MMTMYFKIWFVFLLVRHRRWFQILLILDVSYCLMNLCVIIFRFRGGRSFVGWHICEKLGIRTGQNAGDGHQWRDAGQESSYLDGRRHSSSHRTYILRVGRNGRLHQLMSTQSQAINGYLPHRDLPLVKIWNLVCNLCQITLLIHETT